MKGNNSDKIATQKILKERKTPRPELLDKKPNHQEETVAVLETVGPGAGDTCGVFV